MNSGVGDGFAAKIKRHIDEHHLLQKGDKVLIALSGGADSVVLLHVLNSLKEELDITLYAAHFNHGIRGEEADRDERFCKALCEKTDVCFFSFQADVPSIAKRYGESVELCGRKMRYDYLQWVCDDKLGTAKIATAHHSDDNAETVLWNLTRGAGLAGLAGIPVKRDNIIRPLLCCTRAEIEAYCAENDLAYVTDSTNLSDDYTRNKLRHRIMPVLRELNPSVGESIGRTSSILREADEYLTQISEKELKSAKVPYGWSCERLLQCEPIILKYAVKNILEKAAAPVDFQHTALIIEAMHSNGAVDFGGGYTASCAQGILRIVPKLLSTILPILISPAIPDFPFSPQAFLLLESQFRSSRSAISYVRPINVPPRIHIALEDNLESIVGHFLLACSNGDGSLELCQSRNQSTYK